MEASERFRAFFEGAAVALIVFDERGALVCSNEQAQELVGRASEQLAGQPVERILPARSFDRGGLVAQLRGGAPRVELEASGRRMDGSEVPLAVAARAVETGEGLLVVAALRDVSPCKRSQETLDASLREREALLREVHHRVRNNLQLISSLLALQATYLPGMTTGALLRESQSRVRSLALVHEKLYQGGELSLVPFSAYVRDLAGELLATYAVDLERVTVVVEASPVVVDIDVAIPCGLILRELISNSLKHAFPDGRRGRVEVTAREDGARALQVAVRDDGVGFPPGLEPSNATTLGLKLVEMLATQLHGAVQLRRDGGSEVVLTVGAPHRPPPER